jgi:hypothetical protein
MLVLVLNKNLSWTEKYSDPFGVCFEDVFNALSAVSEVRLVQVMRCRCSITHPECRIFLPSFRYVLT